MVSDAKRGARVGRCMSVADPRFEGVPSRPTNPTGAWAIETSLPEPLATPLNKKVTLGALLRAPLGPIVHKENFADQKHMTKST